MKEDIRRFNEYAMNYDLKLKPIMGKYHHSFRVTNFCKEIARTLNLDEEDEHVAKLCGLYHDIARFEQWAKFETYEDKNSFDHGDKGYEILSKKRFIRDKKIRDIVLQTTKYHNKYEVKDLDEKTLLFCNIVRDADKLDILREQYNENNDEKIVLTKEILSTIYDKKIVDNLSIKSNTDQILRAISWIFDLNFEYSYNVLKEEKIIEKKFALLERDGSNEETSKLRKFILEELEKR